MILNNADDLKCVLYRLATHNGLILEQSSTDNLVQNFVTQTTSLLSRYQLDSEFNIFELTIFSGMDLEGVNFLVPSFLPFSYGLNFGVRDSPISRGAINVNLTLFKKLELVSKSEVNFSHFTNANFGIPCSFDKQIKPKENETVTNFLHRCLNKL